MGLVSEHLKGCGIKITTTVSGVKSSGSGVLYATPNFVSYNYVLTAKHLFQEDSQTPCDLTKLGEIEVFYFANDNFARLDVIKNAQVKERLIVFDEDFAIIKVNKNEKINFRQIIVSQDLQDVDKKFFLWSIFSANTEDLNKFDLRRDDPESKRFKMKGSHKSGYLSGISGAGVFFRNKSVLYGIISRYPNEDFQNATIDCARIDFPEINSKLRSLGLIELTTTTSQHKREINRNVVDIHQAFINNTCLDLELARKRLSSDIKDDWYHDPLKYIDLLNQDYLFAQLAPYLGDKKYKATRAETFYVPKKQFTLRLALICPFIDRVIYMAAVGTIAEKLDGAMIPKVYSARFNRFSSTNLILNGVEQWKKMEYQLSEVAQLKNKKGKFRYGCVIKIDLLNFYDNISKNLLHEKILRVCETENEIKAAKLLHDLLSRMTTKDLGLPQNSDASSLLASFYLNQVDIFMQHHTFEYYRFMDDIRIFCKNKFEARKILQTCEYELRRCYLAINSQKTEIITIIDGDDLQPGLLERKREDFKVKYDIELSKIARYRFSEKHQYINEAFHGSIKLLKDNLSLNDGSLKGDSERKINYAFNTLSILAVKSIHFSSGSQELLDVVSTAINELTERPWITTEVCKVVNLLPGEIVKAKYLKPLKRIVLKNKYNTYSFQTYQIWLLLAKHKCNNASLKTYAIKQIEKNDDTNRAVIAAMVIYMCSVDNDYRRVILRKYGEGFTHGYFQNRTVLIALRSFRTGLIEHTHVNKTLSTAHNYSNKHSKKDLVFVQGYDEDEDSGKDLLEQIYSL